MRKWIIILPVFILCCCKQKAPDTWFTTEKANRYITEIAFICNRDSGKLWGKNLYAPIIFVDRPTRKVFASHPNKNGLLRLRDGVYTGVIPKELSVTGSMIDFGGTTYAILRLPAVEDEFRIKVRAVRNLFHIYQKSIGIMPPSYDTGNKDEKSSRRWLKLEWKALEKAIKSQGEERLQALRDALIFRGASREMNMKYVKDENIFENYEGLATFTSNLLCTNSLQECQAKLLEYLKRIYSVQSYARSYGPIHGALYSLLLYERGYDFKTISTDTIDIAGEVRKTYDIQMPEICRDIAGSLSFNYNMDIIYKEEEDRLNEIRESVHRLTSTFTEKPVVFIELESPSFDFEPEDIHNLDTLGTLFNTIHVADNWGKLTVDKGGCLISVNLKYLRVTAKGYKEEKNHISGDGWQLMLNNDWEIVKVDQNYFLHHLLP
jgi:hypothetical protein